MGVIGKTLGRLAFIAVGGLVLYVGLVIVNGTMSAVSARPNADPDQANQRAAQQLFVRGRKIFRFDTFGDEAFWGDTLQLHQAIAGEKNGGVGPGVSPKTALAVGLKVDADALPAKRRRRHQGGKVNLDDPATTLALLKLNAVVGVKGFFNQRRQRSTSIGITVRALPLDRRRLVRARHRQAARRLAEPRPQRRRDRRRSRPNLKPVADLLGVDAGDGQEGARELGARQVRRRAVHRRQGLPARRQARAATLIPPAFGLAGVNLTPTPGWGSVTYWNAFVANLEMHGQGTSSTRASTTRQQFPVAAQSRIRATCATGPT